MSRNDPGHDLRPLGDVSPDSLDMPVGRSRRLTLERAWRRTAGDALARRVDAVRLSRGVLEITVTDVRWAREVRSLLPALAARLAAEHPELGVRKYRLKGGKEPGGSRALPLPELSEQTPAAGPPVAPPRRKPAESESEPADLPPQRLERIARRYLDRAVERGGGSR